jgi:hypothetical protein
MYGTNIVERARTHHIVFADLSQVNAKDVRTGRSVRKVSAMGEQLTEVNMPMQ